MSAIFFLVFLVNIFNAFNVGRAAIIGIQNVHIHLIESDGGKKVADN